jgi:hypothetical protein
MVAVASYVSIASAAVGPTSDTVTNSVKAFLNAEGADSSSLGFVSMKTAFKACPARTRCLHTIYVLAKFAQGDSKQVALLWNSDRCPSTCYDTLLFGGGALNEKDIEAYGLDAANTAVLLAP